MRQRHFERHYAERIGWLRAAVLVSRFSTVIPVVAGSSLLFLAIMGGVAARTGGARVAVGAGRVTLWGALAMAATAAVGAVFGSVP